MKFGQLKDSLKNEIKPLYIIEGNDNYLLSKAISILKETLVQGLEEFNYLKVDGSDLKAGDLKTILNTLPFGSSYRLVVIENINQQTAKLLEEFSKLTMYGVVVLVVTPSVKINGEVINCDHLDSVELKKWLNNYFKSCNLKIGDEAVNYLIEISNSDLSYLNTELIKLVNYLDAGDIVEISHIKLLFTKNESYFVYNLTNAIDKKDLASCIKILNQLQQDISISEIYTFMGPYFRKMFYCAINNQPQTLATILKTKPYAIQKAKESIQKNGKSFYINLYNKYVSLDYEIKSGKISPINAIYSLLIF